MDSEEELDSDLTISMHTFHSQVASRAAQAATCHLLLVEGGSSSLYPLPPGGEVVIGRANEAHVRLVDGSVSRLHAKLLIAGSDVRVIDLESHNGTRVNGELVRGSRPLSSGDVIVVCPGSPIVFHRESASSKQRAVLDTIAFRQRLEEEIERSLRYKRPVSVLLLTFVSLDKKRLVASLSKSLRLIDVAGWMGETQLAVILPELSKKEALERSDLLLDALLDQGLDARAGLARCPEDGDDADNLLAGARAAAAAAAPKLVGRAEDAISTRTIGDRSVVVADPAMLRLFELIDRLAQSDVPVLILGETGSGKEIAAAGVHHASKRRQGPLVALNCAAIPENLVESELFGHEKGAFSGALAAKQGLLEAANGGTVFLDELAELPLPAQAKLLRVLETKKLTRVGDVRERPIDIRIIAATHRSLEDDVKAGRFRQDLFFRLNGAKLHVPPLRHRKREIAILARMFLKSACERAERAPLELSPTAMQTLLAYAWPGNVRELLNAMELVAVTATDPVVEAWMLPEAMQGETQAPVPEREPEVRAFRPIDEEVRELERERMVEALAAAGGVQTKAAELISMPLRTFVSKMKQYGVSKPKS